MEASVITSLAAALSIVSAATVVSAPIDAPTVRQSRNGEFMTKYYPHTALQRGEQGKVGFELTVDREGFLTSCTITQSSGFANLDRETCNFLTKYAKIQPAHDASGRTVSATQQGFMNWQLPKGAKQLASADATTALDPNKKICKRFARTGSKVGYVKQCMTRQEWALKERINQDEVRRLQDIGGGCPVGQTCNRR